MAESPKKSFFEDDETRRMVVTWLFSTAIAVLLVGITLLLVGGR